MADESSKGPIELPLSELQCLRLELRETKVNALKQQLASSVREKYAPVIALETKQLIDQHVGVKMAELALNKAINQTLEELGDQLPPGFAVKSLEWERSKATALYDVAQAKQRVPEVPVVAPLPESAQADIVK
jgi:hypothetical protein